MMPNQRTLPDHRKLAMGDKRMGPNKMKMPPMMDEPEPMDNLREEASEGANAAGQVGKQKVRKPQY